MTRLHHLGLALGLAAISGTALAGTLAPPPTVTTSPTETSDEEVFLGLEWKIGQSIMPEIELGYRDVDIESDGDVTGGQISLSFDTQMRRFGKVKLEGISGDEDVQGQLGLGYNLARQGVLMTGGVQGNHVFAGVDYTLGHGFDVMAGLNTIGDYDPPAEDTTLTCSEGTLVDGVCVLPAPQT